MYFFSQLVVMMIEIIISIGVNRIHELWPPAPDGGRTTSRFRVGDKLASHTSLPDTTICLAKQSRRKNTERSRRSRPFPWLLQLKLQKKPGFRSHRLPNLQMCSKESKEKNFPVNQFKKI